MERIALKDGLGSWFDADRAKVFHETVFSSGDKLISAATKLATEHECLFLTSDNTWVKKCWSDINWTPSTYEIINDNAAWAWLSQNNLSPTNINLKKGDKKHDKK